MRIEKTIELGSKKITIKELCVGDIYTFSSEIMELTEKFNYKKARICIESLLPRVSNLTLKDFQQLSFSELDELEKVFLEVNDAFLSRLEKYGILKAVKTLAKQFYKEHVDGIFKEIDTPVETEENQEKAQEEKQPADKQHKPSLQK